MQNFRTLGLPQPLLHTLEAMKFTEPTPIQAKSIPFALKGEDVLGSAQTGTGKTGAFGIPLVAQLMNNPQGTALVLTPTRELAVQVMQALKRMLGKRSAIKTALLMGGESIFRQYQQLKANPRLFVGTPGRINDHLLRGTLSLNDTKFLVLDETDRMLDMGFGIQLDKILKHVPKVRQTLMFSATLPPNIVKLSQKYLKDPVRVSVGSTVKPVEKIKQTIIHTSEAEKYNVLVEQIEQCEGSILVFVKTKQSAEKLTHQLRHEEYEVDTIHGNLRQNKRDRVIKAFRNQQHRILVATDIAARGLDIPHIAHVINYDLPQCPEDYIHRIGRTGRAGAVGNAINLVTKKEEAKWKAIHRLIHSGETSVSDAKNTEVRSTNRSRRYEDKNKKAPAKKSFGSAPARHSNRDEEGGRHHKIKRRSGDARRKNIETERSSGLGSPTKRSKRAEKERVAKSGAAKKRGSKNRDDRKWGHAKPRANSKPNRR